MNSSLRRSSKTEDPKQKKERRHTDLGLAQAPAVGTHAAAKKQHKKKERRHTDLTALGSVLKEAKGKQRRPTDPSINMKNMDPQDIIEMLESFAGGDRDMAANVMDNLKNSEQEKHHHHHKHDRRSSKTKARRSSSKSEAKQRPSISENNGGEDWANVSITDIIGELK